MGKRLLCVSIVQHFSKVTLGLEVTGSNHWVNTHPLIEHANLIQFIHVRPPSELGFPNLMEALSPRYIRLRRRPLHGKSW